MITDMNKEDKELLLKDLCARLPYGVKLQKFNEPDSAFELYSVNKESGEIMFYKYKGETLTIGDVGKLYRRNILLYKPFLRPLSSMTKEEIVELKWLNEKCDSIPTFKYVPIENYRIYDWMNRHHLDYRGLIEKNLALDCTNLNIY